MWGNLDPGDPVIHRRAKDRQSSGFQKSSGNLIVAEWVTVTLMMIKTRAWG